MPGRSALIALVLFWIAALGWQFAVVIWPVWRTGNPPGQGISLSDETTASAPARYRIFLNGQEIALARLQLTHDPANETFHSLAEFSALGVKQTPQASGASPLGTAWLPAKSSLDVNRAGQPQAATSQIKIPTGEVTTILARQGNRMLGTKAITLDASPEVKLPGQTIDFPLGEGRAMLSLLHPAWRWNGLRAGQRWTARLLDPLADSLLTVNQAHGGQPVSCEVAQATENPPQTEGELPCWKITATREDLEITIWSAVQTGKVMRQRVRMGAGPSADVWELVREELLQS